MYCFGVIVINVGKVISRNIVSQGQKCVNQIRARILVDSVANLCLWRQQGRSLLQCKEGFDPILFHLKQLAGTR